jgi:phage gp46-like protein
MGDIRIIWDRATGSGDFAMSGSDLATGFELETAVLISLFTDAEADPGDITLGDTDPRGWWADIYSALEDPALPTISNDRIGSKLWQVFNMPRSQPTLNWMASEIRKSLNWMLVDGVASSIDVWPRFAGQGGVGAAIRIFSNGVPTLYDYAWAQETGGGGYTPSPAPLMDEDGNPLFDEAGNPLYGSTR